MMRFRMPVLTVVEDQGTNSPSSCTEELRRYPIRREGPNVIFPACHLEMRMRQIREPYRLSLDGIYQAVKLQSRYVIENQEHERIIRTSFPHVIHGFSQSRNVLCNDNLAISEEISRDSKRNRLQVHGELEKKPHRDLIGNAAV